MGEETKLVVGQDPREWFEKHIKRFASTSKLLTIRGGVKCSINKWEHILKAVDHLESEDFNPSNLKTPEAVKSIEAIESVEAIVARCGLCIVFDNRSLSEVIKLFDPFCVRCPLNLSGDKCGDREPYLPIFRFIIENEVYDEFKDEPEHNLSEDMLTKIREYGIALIAYLTEIEELLEEKQNERV